MIKPCLIKYIFLKFLKVCSRCVITIKVTFPSRFSIQSTIAFSVSISSELVASSNTNIFDFLYRALAIPILCLCPPESLMPRLPIIVLSCKGKSETNLES